MRFNHKSLNLHYPAGACRISGWAWPAVIVVFMKKIILSLFASLAAISLQANEIEEAALLIEAGRLPEAREILQEAAKKNNLANLYLGRIAFLEYDYPEAARFYAAVKGAARNSDTFLEHNRQLQTGRQMLAHLEKIVVVDSVSVDSTAFFNSYRLSPSAGRILAADDVKKLNKAAANADTGFTNEFEDILIWSAPDNAGNLRLAESSRLIDGSWSAPEWLPLTPDTAKDEEEGEDDVQIADFNIAFPFMLDDGVTLYYASDSEDSLGGYDIFVSTRDASDGEFLEPRNVGMPFNSPYNDYLMAIDELTGIGWWATDRNAVPGQVTVYAYIIPETRENVAQDDEDILYLASLSDYRLTQYGEEDKVREAKNALKNITAATAASPEFNLSMGGGTSYTQFSDFKNKQAATQMRAYLKEKETYEADREKLAALRSEYYMQAKPARMGKQIQQLEESLREKATRLKESLSEIYQLEKGKNR